MTAGRWTAIVLAGQRPGIDPLAAHFGSTVKALVSLGGVAMLTRVVRTLHATPDIGDIIVLAQDTNALSEAVVAGGGAILAVSGKGISVSIAALLDKSALWPVLVTTADHPLLLPDHIAAFLAKAEDADLSVGMVEREIVLARYPGAHRTWLKFRDGHWSGANLFTLAGPRTLAALTLWAAAEQDRKRAWKLFFHFGPWLALRAVTRTIGLAEALSRAGRNLGLSARLVALPFADAAIDVDKPADYDLAVAILGDREQS
jgi:GTP:adenosylcobinamide-phosphate guanylyltransferase